MFSFGWVAGVLLAAATAPAAPPEPHNCTYEVIRADEGARRQAFLGWLRAHADELGDSAGLLDEPRSLTLEVLIADVDNDGHDEYLLVTSQGSGRYLSMWVFRPLRSGWALVSPTPL